MSFRHSIVSTVWSSLNRVARQIADFKPKIRLPFQVIIVGNIEAGGTGKTPIVAELSNTALRQKKCVVILTRGYKGQSERTGFVMKPFEEFSPVLVGDEPALLRSLSPGAWIGVGADRLKSLRSILDLLKASNGASPDLVIFDDGLQQFSIQADERVICISGKSWGTDTYFRETFSTIKVTDTVVLTKNSVFPPELSAYPKKVKVDWEVQSPSNPSAPYLLVHGVGRPDTVKPMLVSAGWIIRDERVFEDHAHYEKATVQALFETARTQGLRIVTTGKDAVKWKALGFKVSDFDVVEPKLKVVEGMAIWNSLLGRL